MKKMNIGKSYMKICKVKTYNRLVSEYYRELDILDPLNKPRKRLMMSGGPYSANTETLLYLGVLIKEMRKENGRYDY
jgi:hypothetical protein